MRTTINRTKYFLKILTLVLICIGPALSVQGQTPDNPHGKFTIDIDCAACHTSTGWVPAKHNMDFNHNTDTQFELLGRHSVISCKSCHLDLQFSEPNIDQEDCASCHVDVHRGQFVQSCTNCHNMQSFQMVDGRRIHSSTLFPLTGAHMQVSCASCHNDDTHGAFANLETDCFGCHEQEYNNTTSIDHREQGFSTECEQCHTTVAWSPATFDHLQASGGFALLGAHNRITCESCHRTPGFETIFAVNDANDCFGCHEADYNRQHGGSGFPTDCQTCHNVNSWDDAEFEDHDRQFFPIFSGRHQGTWSSCQTCHENPSTFTQFTCFNCHEHSQSNTDPRHREVSGYVYDSQACYSCHQDGRGEDD